MPQQPRSARRHYLWSAALSQRAVREARRVRRSGLAPIAAIVTLHQATAAFQAQPAIAQMLNEQGIDEAAEALLNSLAFTTSVAALGPMIDQTANDYEFDRLVASLVQEAGRAAEQVATTARPRIGYVRHLSPPSCSRCAVLAGRVYTYSQGFLRHPNCDCTMVPATIGSPLAEDPVDLMRRGLVTGLSKADQQAIADGADFNQVVNVRSRRAGLTASGRVLSRAGRPTPEAIYAASGSRDDAIQRLITAGYLRS